MAGIREMLIDLGVKAPDLVAGFAGGVVNAVIFRRVGPAAIVGSVLVGMLTANYLGAPVAQYIRTSDSTASFLVGVGGMAFVQSIAEAMRTWRPFGGTGARDAKPD